MARNLVGASVNAGGTRIAAVRAVGTNQLDTTKPANDKLAVVPHGNMNVHVGAAINMGILQRDSAGVLTELNPPQPFTRVG